MIFNFGGEKSEESQPDSYRHLTVPKGGGEEISAQEMHSVNLEAEIKYIKEQIKELRKHPDDMNIAKANALENKLEHLENPVGQWYKA